MVFSISEMLTFPILRAVMTDSLGENVAGCGCRPANGMVEHGCALGLGSCIYDI